MYCSHCGNSVKQITKDVTFRVCTSKSCRYCEVTEPPNMMGDSPRTYGHKLNQEEWLELINEVGDNYMDIDMSEISDDFEEVSRDFEKIILQTLDRLLKSNESLKKENKKLKKKIKKLKRRY
ncbi:hypothetical protein [Mammaliicoccus phage vB_MscM-PMS3]|nr:hypothetical protein [Mammaliicoccus phage vB_MscM-PMS3]